MRTKRSAGTTRPAIAAETGTRARDQLVSSPIANSRRTSSPTVKKKIRFWPIAPIRAAIDGASTSAGGAPLRVE
ncbi:hypothetical protein GCM10023194_40120 [Planotetraspora phitsanulokensis]|uniref:hypothetical protein n=1 Tax=Planotetraspora phitsanulokensis TaxID=575192 RepID=UPI001EF175C8|nr:hypothetical protein [Planotetraspora phitsanulokensis]